MKKIKLSSVLSFSALLVSGLLADVTLAHSTSAQTTWKSCSSVNQECNTFYKFAKSLEKGNYNLIFTSIVADTMSSFEYRSFKSGSNDYAYLINLEGTANPIFRKNNKVYYLKQNVALESNRIAEVLPYFFYSKLDTVAQNYKLAELGKERYADRLGVTYRLENKNHQGYVYHLTFDEETNLLLQAVLLNPYDLSGSPTVINRFVLQYLDLIPNDTSWHKTPIDETKLNKITAKPTIDKAVVKAVQERLNLSWIPEGFALKSAQELKESLDGKNFHDFYVMSYYDGLFSFYIYVNKELIQDSNSHFFFIDGDTTLYAENFVNNDVFVIGQIPLIVAKKIVDSIQPVNKKVVHLEGYGQQIIRK